MKVAFWMESIFEWICLQSMNEALSVNSVFVVSQKVTGTMNETEFNECNDTVEATPVRPYTQFETALLIIVTGFLSLMTIGGNVLVMISFKMDRRLQTVNNYFLLSLAVADFMIGMISMPLFTTYTLLGGWRLGPVVCDCWLALDYLCSNASVLNLLMISFDRYFSVTNPLRYRAKRNSRRAAIMIAMAWIISLILWPPWIFAWPYIEGKRSVPDDQCYIQFLETNTYITVSTAVIAFYIPVVIMCFLYYKIWRETEIRKQYLAELIAENEQSEQTPACLAAAATPNDAAEKNCTHRVKDFLITLCNVDCDDGGEEDSNSPGGTTPSSAETPIQSSRATSVTMRPEQLVYLQGLLNQDEEDKRRVAKDSIYTVMIRLPDPSDPEVDSPQPTVTMIPDESVPPMRSSLSTGALMIHSVHPASDHRLTRCSSSEVLSASRLNMTGRQVRNQRSGAKKRVNKVQEKKHDRKAARTLSAILLAFIITWTPYNVLVLVKSVETFVSCHDIIPQALWDFSYYLCYLNSMINPLCYALANANFRKTYWRILTCTWRKKSKLSIIRGLHSKAS